MIDQREDFIRIYPGAFPAAQARQLCQHLKALFAQGFGKSRQASGHGTKTVSDDQQIWDIRDVDASDYRGTVMPALFESLKKYVDEFDILSSFTLVGWWLKAQLTRKGEGYHAWHFESSTQQQGQGSGSHHRRPPAGGQAIHQPWIASGGLRLSVDVAAARAVRSNHQQFVE